METGSIFTITLDPDYEARGVEFTHSERLLEAMQHISLFIERGGDRHTFTISASSAQPQEWIF